MLHRNFNCCVLGWNREWCCTPLWILLHRRVENFIQNVKVTFSPSTTTHSCNLLVALAQLQPFSQDYHQLLQFVGSACAVTTFSPNTTNQRIHITLRTDSTPCRLALRRLTQPLPAMSAVRYTPTIWASDRAGGERLDESHLGKFMAGALPSITYSLDFTVQHFLCFDIIFMWSLNLLNKNTISRK